MSNKIGTHSGTFHCDEVLACAMLKKLSEFSKSEIVRSRDPAVLDTCKIVVDVGGIYDHSKMRYDHHQATFSETMHSLRPEIRHEIRLSSAGLIYAHYGERVIANILGLKESDPNLPILFKKVYNAIILEVDAIDNGVKISDAPNKYSINTCLSSRVSWLNPAWNDQNPDETSCFYKALKMVDEEFTNIVTNLGTVWLPARDLVKKAYEERAKHDPSGCLVVFLEEAPAWKDHLLNVEKEDSSLIRTPNCYKGRPVFCVYKRKEGNWSCQTIPISSDQKFDARLSLPKEWRGLRDSELDKVVGINGSIMVHATGFLGIHQTFDGAMHMAKHTLKEANLL